MIKRLATLSIDHILEMCAMNNIRDRASLTVPGLQN